MAEIGYECAHCGRWMREDERNGAMEGAPFVATTQAKEKGNVGFYTWAIHSKDPSHRWALIIAKYISQRANPQERQDWTNLWLALPYVVAVEGRLDRADVVDGVRQRILRNMSVGFDRSEEGRRPKSSTTSSGTGRSYS